MLSLPATTVQQPFCSKQIVMVAQGASSVAISPLNPTDKNSLVNVIFQVRTYVIIICSTWLYDMHLHVIPVPLKLGHCFTSSYLIIIKRGHKTIVWEISCL